MGIAFIIALALSLDGFGVGIAYGLKKIKIPLGSLIIIASCSAFAMGTSMLFGHLIMPKLTFISPKTFGAAVLIAIGFYQLLRAIRGQETAAPAMAATVIKPDSYRTLLSLNLNVFGLVIQILKTPDAADVDRSGVINLTESLFLGIALAMDSFASGMAATMTGVKLYVIFWVALMQIIMIGAGQVFIGKLPSSLIDKAKYLPGLVLMVIGSLKIF
ncbi:MAG: manganese efflux pump MntP [Candidatus Dichloromethanomonas elyunquensis]|nr:MAG: manganese efflux pump MntP [Candidatus Dichloromethanomonas elyunquensis]